MWEASERCVAIADDSKRAARFGSFPLPVEVVAYGHATTARRIVRASLDFGFTAPCVLRGTTGFPVLTDNGNVIYDVAFGAIDDPETVEALLKSLTGVVEHGLFIGLASEALIATPSGVVTAERLERPRLAEIRLRSLRPRARVPAACARRAWRRCPAPASVSPRSTASAAPA